jgi:D-alanyl-D-alanine carboxypeptidase/D-alanyl-D-alanine-endopeptidase (penicillin-binding protein 4)
VKNVLKGLGVDMSRGIKIQDGSGLSRQNLVSPDFFCRYLEAMMGQECFEDFVESLPSPGGTGTLASNMKDYPAGTKARIKAKSGSMSGVRCYSGYIIPSEGCKDDTIIFSIMVNNTAAPSWKVRQLLDKIMATLTAAN